MSISSDPYASLNCVPLAGTPLGCVVIQEDLKSDFDALPEATRARFVRIMELWTERMALTQEQFNGNEGRAQKGDINVLIQAFKAFKIRLYGFATEVGDRRSFLIVAIDPAKKQNKADPKVLKRAKDRAIELTTLNKSSQKEGQDKKKHKR